MSFNYSSVPAHPRKIFSLMNKFVNENICIPRKVEIFKNGLTVAEFLDMVDAGTPVWDTYDTTLTFKISKGERCAAWNTCDLEVTENCKITMSFDELMDEGSTATHANAISRSSTLRGFSKMLFVLLHEVGHFATAEQAAENEEEDPSDEMVMEWTRDAFARSNNWKEFHRIFQAHHFNAPDEKLATDWAIEWLSNPENRKSAKAFEKEFFKAWRG